MRTLEFIAQAAADTAITIAAIDAAAQAAALMKAISGIAGEGHIQPSDGGGPA